MGLLALMIQTSILDLLQDPKPGSHSLKDLLLACLSVTMRLRTWQANRKSEGLAALPRKRGTGRELLGHIDGELYVLTCRHHPGHVCTPSSSQNVLVIHDVFERHEPSRTTLHCRQQHQHVDKTDSPGARHLLRESYHRTTGSHAPCNSGRCHDRADGCGKEVEGPNYMRMLDGP